MIESATTLFTRIINREVPAEFVYEDDKCVVINDIAPQAPVHMLVIPRKPLSRLSDATPEDKNLMGHLLWVAGEVARRQGIANAFRLIVNNGAEAGQTIFHLHLHVLGRKSFDHADLSSI
ncbi:MAG: histidine triad nucleotide-binding protein [Cellvibrionales bacterium TMED148]|nr:histidine triad nucleotide-binding protein [Porticoccaceae bacterium]RPG88981.1 MAG: histidine triad nucleotide-binding protein [Cellvibrionales bacterium TMED148]|tara:strand:+ start:74 stop:433 length:360 start_codon:yes stop_codon:yes gene_type:complete